MSQDISVYMYVGGIIAKASDLTVVKISCVMFSERCYLCNSHGKSLSAVVLSARAVQTSVHSAAPAQNGIVLRYQM